MRLGQTHHTKYKCAIVRNTSAKYIKMRPAHVALCLVAADIGFGLALWVLSLATNVNREHLLYINVAVTALVGLFMVVGFAMCLCAGWPDDGAQTDVQQCTTETHHIALDVDNKTYGTMPIHGRSYQVADGRV